jgi:ABC-type antimicrobial peptide transport system permease subunit
MASALVVKSKAATNSVESWVRSEMAALDPALPATIQTFREHLGEVSARPRFQAVLLGLFAAIGLLMAGIGLYALISFTVEQRKREIGVRLALGASRGQIARMVAGHALRWTLCGLAAGLAGSFAAARAIRTLLFHVPPADPLSFGAAALLLLSLAAASALLPSRRAAALDPVRILRED